MTVRLRIPELLEERGLTAYQLAQQSGDRIGMSSAYRLAKLGGRLGTFPAELLDALCETLGVSPGDLFERTETKKRRRP